ncbi:hypothetical protein KP78_21870 [Jeotgalibacillus soli]|uniref:Uncharacterized protein n=1 Tax=Jeotgalibacillus soli TaxID=889306 RepID=A0A0C2RVP6_9BACL|nr:hypothetical protein KP78_21870 [Jeotgalibacillus soli]
MNVRPFDSLPFILAMLKSIFDFYTVLIVAEREQLLRKSTSTFNKACILKNTSHHFIISA